MEQKDSITEAVGHDWLRLDGRPPPGCKPSEALCSVLYGVCLLVAASRCLDIGHLHHQNGPCITTTCV